MAISYLLVVTFLLSEEAIGLEIDWGCSNHVSCDSCLLSTAPCYWCATAGSCMEASSELLAELSGVFDPVDITAFATMLGEPNFTRPSVAQELTVLYSAREYSMMYGDHLGPLESTSSLQYLLDDTRCGMWTVTTSSCPAIPNFCGIRNQTPVPSESMSDGLIIEACDACVVSDGCGFCMDETLEGAYESGSLGTCEAGTMKGPLAFSSDPSARPTCQHWVTGNWDAWYNERSWVPACLREFTVARYEHLSCDPLTQSIILPETDLGYTAFRYFPFHNLGDSACFLTFSGISNSEDEQPVVANLLINAVGFSGSDEYELVLTTISGGSSTSLHSGRMAVGLQLVVEFAPPAVMSFRRIPSSMPVSAPDLSSLVGLSLDPADGTPAPSTRAEGSDGLGVFSGKGGLEIKWVLQAGSSDGSVGVRTVSPFTPTVAPSPAPAASEIDAIVTFMILFFILVPGLLGVLAIRRLWKDQRMDAELGGHRPDEELDATETERQRLEQVLSTLAEFSRAGGKDTKVSKALLTIIGKAASSESLQMVDDKTCCVCLSEIEKAQSRRTLFPCLHKFHRQCVDEWFTSQSKQNRIEPDHRSGRWMLKCPMCRGLLGPLPPDASGKDTLTPVSPLSAPLPLLPPPTEFGAPGSAEDVIAVEPSSSAPPQMLGGEQLLHEAPQVPGRVTTGESGGQGEGEGEPGE